MEMFGVTTQPAGNSMNLRKTISDLREALVEARTLASNAEHMSDIDALHTDIYNVCDNALGASDGYWEEEKRLPNLVSKRRIEADYPLPGD